MIAYRTIAVCLLLLGAAAPLRADTVTAEGAEGSFEVTPLRAVIELFTSQGCGDCPPADALMRKYAEKSDIIALTLPVDYWDYLGWKDSLASPRYAERQRDYAKRFDTGPVGTPEAVVNGAARALGSSEDEIDQAIRATQVALASGRVPIRTFQVANSMIIEVGAAKYADSIKESTIWLAFVQAQASVSVGSGENKGRALTYYNVVREMTPLGLWNGRPTTIRLGTAATMHPDSSFMVILLQEENNGPIIGASKLVPRAAPVN